MNTLPTALLILTAALRPLALDAHPPGQWRFFESKTQHFSVRYPASWHRPEAAGVPVDDNVFSIINFPDADRAEGVIIKKYGALIDVNAAPSDVHSIEDWIRKYGVGDVVLDDRDIPVARPAADGCVKMRWLVTRSEVGPGTYFIGTNCFCSTARGLYRVLLTNWEGDPNQTELQDTALKIALSLRSQ
jgi:hypothetical protein